MRCPTCNTENEADSRFCGGCGARIGQQAEPRLAPTHKITDDAPYPQQAAQPVAASNAPVSYAPPSMPPTSRLGTPVPGSEVRPASQPPALRAPSRAQISTASASFAVPPRRPLGLMVALLIVDLGLAAAGAVLLGKGLASDEPTNGAKAEPAPAEQKTEAPTGAATPTQVTAAAAAAPPAAAATTLAATTATPAPPAPMPAAPAPATPAARKKPVEPKLAAKPAEATPASTAPATATSRAAAEPDAKRVAAVPSGPQDPYATDPAPAVVDTAREIDAAAARSKATLDRCASEHGTVQGSIEIAFQVRPDGRIANAAAVANSTGNSELARCLVAEIASWRVSAHGGAAINMSRPFTYR